jgi:hypothetical protein
MKFALLLIPLIFLSSCSLLRKNVVSTPSINSSRTEVEKVSPSSIEGFGFTESGSEVDISFQGELILKSSQEIQHPEILSITGTTQYVLIQEYFSEASRETVFDTLSGKIIDIHGVYPVLNSIEYSTG